MRTAEEKKNTNRLAPFAREESCRNWLIFTEKCMLNTFLVCRFNLPLKA